MRIQNCDTRKKMKNTEVHSSSAKFSNTILKDANISKEEIITNQSTLHSVQPIRNLPNILRSNNTRTSRNHKSLNKVDTSFVSSAEDVNTSSELNTTLSSIDLDMEANYNKNTLPKSHHQRKQVHNPLDIQYDIPDCNNNKNTQILQKINQLNTLHIPPSHEENQPIKRLKQKKRLLNKKSKKVTARKSNSRTQMSRKKSDFDTLAAIPDINTKNTIVMQNANNVLDNNILIQPVYRPDIPNINVNNLNDIATKSIEQSNIFQCNNEVYNVDRKYGINPVISCVSTEFNPPQHKTIQKDITSYEFPITENSWQQELIDRDIGSNFLYGSKVLYSCTCANCTSHDKDIIFYEDPVSTSTSSDDTDAELFTCDLYTDIYDFYGSNYFHIFGDDLVDFDKTNLYCEEFGEEKSATKENTYIGSNSTTELIESSANLSPVEQSESQNLQSCHIDRDICVGSYPAGQPNKTVQMENVRIFDETNISNYLNSENLSMKENKIISQDEALIQTAISTNVPVSNSKCQTQENKKDLYVIQCSQCGKLFNKKHQLWKHFTHCDFYKENFKCHICSKTYRHKSSLAQHLRIAHNVSHGSHEKFYKCNKCSKSYVRFRAFQRHVLLHDD